MLAGESLLITEFMASNSSTLRDRFREYSDWIELHNPTTEAVSVNGWSLTDDADDLQKWQLPDVSLAADGYLVVFASGENRIDPDSELHANFKLSSGGEYLALVRPDATISHEYAPEYPPQSSDVSYGLVFSEDGPLTGVTGFFPNATPSEANALAAASDVASAVEFSVQRGFFAAPFELTLSTETPEATIRYTTDGTAPTNDHGEVYDQAITIDTTTMLRAATFGDGLLPSDVTTHSYLFLDHVLTQDGAGLPTQWGYFDDRGPPRPARARANYEVDPEIVNHDDYRDTIKDDLRSLPTLSLVVDPDDLWGFENGLYSNPERTGDAWERPVSMEWINEQGETEFHENAGLRIHGGWARRFSQTKKLSFRVIFRSQYGEPTLDYPVFGDQGEQDFQALVLRAGFNDSWRDSGSGSNTYTQDQWTRQAQRDMGGQASRDRYVHLYLNGLYWGVYSPTERMNAEWAAATMGGEPEEWDVINTGGSVIDGNTRSWNALMRAVDGRDVDYEEVQSLLDVEDFIDYMIVNQYVGNWDWPHNNWYASRRNVAGGKWRFHTWDAEAAFQNGIGENRVDNDIRDVAGPAKVYLGLWNIPEFQLLYADRINKHFFNGGALTTEANIKRLDSIAAEIDRAMVGESARWGDGRDDTGRPITRETWARRIDAINNGYFERRSLRVLDQFRNANLLPSVAAPVFDQHGGPIAPHTDVLLTTDIADGEIYFTLDGSDPRGPDGQPGTNAIPLNTKNLVANDSPAKALVPTGDVREADWNAVTFDDSGWIDAVATIGYDTGVIEDLISVPEGFDIIEIQSTARLDTVELANQLLEGINVKSRRTVQDVPFLNYLGGSRGGNFGDDVDFPSAQDNFAMDVTGSILVAQAGTYTFLVTSNDGARLEIDGTVLFADEERHGTEDRLVTVELSEGTHDLRLFMFDRTAIAVLEFAYAVGEKTEFDDTFRLVGDVQHRSYADLIRTDLQDSLAGQNSSAYLRIPFEVEQSESIDRLSIKSRYDDGFIAYLNGTEITRHFAPETPAFDSAATGARFDSESLRPELVDLSEFRELLTAGKNLLAIQLLNADKNDPDLFFSTRLFATDNGTPIRLEKTSQVKARVFVDGTWSALTDAEFSTAVPASVSDLRISEIHYHPRASTDAEIAAGFDNSDDFEFVEVLNIGPQSIDLAHAAFVTTTIGDNVDGIAFRFADGAVSELAPGQRAVIVEDLDAFRFRYGTGLPVAGQWSGQLGNSSERITLRIGDDTVHSFAYSDQWYPATDGLGASLEVVSPATTSPNLWGSAPTWRAAEIDGSPGLATPSPPGDANRDGLFDASDLILVFQTGEYEDDVAGNSTWEDGDWNHDGEFSSRDLVVAFQFGAYGAGPVAAATGHRSESEFESKLRPQSAKAATSDADLLAALDASRDARDRLFRDWTSEL